MILRKNIEGKSVLETIIKEDATSFITNDLFDN